MSYEYQEKDSQELSNLIDEGKVFRLFKDILDNKLYAYIDSICLAIDFRIREFVKDHTDRNGKLPIKEYKKLIFGCKIKTLRLINEEGNPAIVGIDAKGDAITSTWKQCLVLGISQNAVARFEHSNCLKDISFEEKQSWLEELKRYASLKKEVHYEESYQEKMQRLQEIKDARKETWWTMTEGEYGDYPGSMTDYDALGY
jgi:hypothetical protein